MKVGNLKFDVDMRVLLAFGAIYVLWGTTFLAIRIAVLEFPPLFTAGLRFFIAGTLLYAYMRFRRQPNPSAIEWRNLALISICMFVFTYGAVFWAEQYVSSGITSVIEATLPITAIILEMFVFRTQRFEVRLFGAVLVGFFGVALLFIDNGAQQLAVLPCLAIFAGGIAWSVGAVLSGQLTLPRSKPMTAGIEMMLGGAVLLMLSAICGEMQPFPHLSLRAGLALAYLIVFGSLIAYTAYVWLLGRMSVTRVASHAYVNPLIAVALGYFAAGEIVTLRTLISALLVLGSVSLILTRRSDAPQV
ncbi:MAG: EamA family transporter [Pseudomonadota bacterium]|nr:EamA family transporter [Pseudomonadota bacterium]